MEATFLCSHYFYPQLLRAKRVKFPGGQADCNLQLYRQLYAGTHVSLKTNLSRRHHMLNRPFLSRANKSCSVNFSDRLRSDFVNVEETSLQSLNHESTQSRLDDGEGAFGSNDANNIKTLQLRSKTFRNRYLNFVRLGSVLNNAAESFFKSEIRRRLFVTAVLLVISRVGYFIPLPGFDRRLIPENYLSFASGAVDELGDFAAEIKLSFFQLGISPQIAASIIMQVGLRTAILFRFQTSEWRKSRAPLRISKEMKIPGDSEGRPSYEK